MQLKARILVVEDSALLRAVATDILTRHGYDVVEAADGVDGLAMAREHRPDVVLCDVEMPRLDGFGFLAGRREIPEVADVPVVFLTAHEGSEQVARALDEGAHDYLRKPLDPTELVARVRAAARTKRLNDELRERNADLQALSETYRHLVEQVPAVIYRLAVEPGQPPRPVFVSPQAGSILGLPADDCVASAERMLERVGAAHREDLRLRWSAGRAADAGEALDFAFSRPDGEEIWLRDLSSVLATGSGAHHIQGLLFDVTEVKQAESQHKRMELELRLAQKLEAVGQLAAGLAHEINTPIQFVADTMRFVSDAFTDVLALIEVYQDVIATAGERPEAVAARVQEVVRAEEVADLEYLQDRIPAAIQRGADGVQRVTAIVHSMREFAHPPTTEQAPVDLNEALRNTLVVAANEYKYIAEVQTELGELPPVVCNGGDINQVFLNLIVNASHAIRDAVGDGGERGTIVIRTRRDGEDVIASIGDSGTGMAPDVLARIFDPFFTTKDVGSGTGQGLAIAHAIVVDRHGGSIGVETAVGAGTRFDVRLPVAGAGPLG